MALGPSVKRPTDQTMPYGDLLQSAAAGYNFAGFLAVPRRLHLPTAKPQFCLIT